MLAQVAAQCRCAQVEDEVVERAVAGLGDLLHLLEVVLLGGEAALAAEVAAERRAGGRVGGAEPAVLERGLAELDPGPAEPDGCARAVDRAAEQRVERTAAVVLLVFGPAAAPALADRPEGAHLALIRVEAQRAQQHPDPADAVDQRVVHLHVDREAVALEALDQVHLPQRPVQVELVAVQARDEHRRARAGRPDAAGRSGARGSRGRCRGPRASVAACGRRSGPRPASGSRAAGCCAPGACPAASWPGSRAPHRAGCVNSNRPPTCIGVSRDSSSSQAASSGEIRFKRPSSRVARSIGDFGTPSGRLGTP